MEASERPPDLTTHGSATHDRGADHLSALTVLERRYGPIDDVDLDRIRLEGARTRLRREAIERQISELMEERRRLDDEWSRKRLAHDVFAEDLADRIRRRHGEGWSPTPVVGFRRWELDPHGRLAGATGYQWATPVLESTCARAVPGDDLPHTVESCSAVGHGCGIYAVRTPHELEAGAPSDWIVGAVALTGKVVEHERGYRAFRATVTAVMGEVDGQWVETTDAGLIDSLFADPAATARHLVPVSGAPPPGGFTAAADRLERSISWT